MISNIFNLENIGGSSSILFHGESNSSDVLNNTHTWGSSRLSRSTGTSRSITSEARSSQFSGSSSRSPFSSFTRDITSWAVNISSSTIWSRWESKSQSSFRIFNSHGGFPSVGTTSTLDGVSWKRGTRKFEFLGRSLLLPNNKLTIRKGNWGFHGELDRLTFSGNLKSLSRFTATS